MSIYCPREVIRVDNPTHRLESLDAVLRLPVNWCAMGLVTASCRLPSHYLSWHLWNMQQPGGTTFAMSCPPILVVVASPGSYNLSFCLFLTSLL